MTEILLVIHLLIALALITTVLLQRSEGGALGIGGGGGGGGGNLFSSRGVGNALTRATAMLAVAFFITSFTLTLLATRANQPGSVLEGVKTETPAKPKSVLPSLPDSSTPATPQAPTSE